MVQNGYLMRKIILFLIILLSLVEYANADTVSVETDAELNEGWKQLDTTWADGTAANFIGVIGSYTGDIWYDSYVRFANITIPKGSPIVSAYIQFYGADFSPTSAGTAAGSVFGLDEDNTANFSADPSGRSLTSASVAYSFTGWTQATANAASKTGDLKTIVQEIINRDGWSSGNAIGFRFDTSTKTGSNYAFWAGNDNTYGGANLDPELTINYLVYLDSGIRYRKDGTTYSVAYQTLTASHKLRFRKGGTTVGIPLVATTNAYASHFRIWDGSAVKSLALYP